MDSDLPREDVHSEVQASKKRKAATSSRGVAFLSPEQLARKRANDREAQRAIRERTKNQIDRLNQRIRDLESQQPYHDLQAVLREKEFIQVENTDIKKRLESVLDIIQPILRTSRGLNELAVAAEQSPLTQRDGSMQASDARYLQNNFHDLSDASPSTGAEVSRPWIFSNDAPSVESRRFSSNDSHFEHHRSSHLPSDMPFDERLGVDFLLESGQRRAVDPNLQSPHQQSDNDTSINQPAQYAPPLVAHLTYPRHITATCSMDGIILEFLQDQRNRAAQGISLPTLASLPQPDLTSLHFTEHNIELHPLMKLVKEVVMSSNALTQNTERFAMIYIMYLIVRWQVEPTEESYARIPHWLTPRPAQLFAAHPFWLDFIPWPELRDKIIRQQTTLPLETFFHSFLSFLSLDAVSHGQPLLLPNTIIHQCSEASDPEAAFTALINEDIAGILYEKQEQWFINPLFERHIRDLNNWSLRRDFKDSFPSLADYVRIREES